MPDDGVFVTAGGHLLQTRKRTLFDFQQVDGLTIPRAWAVRYERSGNTATEWKYELSVQLGSGLARRLLLQEPRSSKLLTSEILQDGLVIWRRAA